MPMACGTLSDHLAKLGDMGMNMCNLVMSLVPAVTNHKTQQKHINPLANCSIMHMKCCIHYGSQGVCCVPEAHGKGYFAHGKAFAVCNTRQSAHGIQTSAKSHFAVCFFSGTRQRLCRVLERHSVNNFPKK